MAAMDVLKTNEAMRAARARVAGRLAFVPTMGALHEGHLSLVRRARELADVVAVSIFVNPTQFSAGEDLDKYPRPLERDLDLCRAEGASLVYNPEPAEVYPPHEPEVIIDVPQLAADLEGARRPGHFVGVCRVVAKLFGIVQPDVACFGMKDYQQLRVIEAMTVGLCLPIDIEPCPTVREPDGLAMSSRNAYLSAEDRPRALCLSKALREAQQMIEAGESEPAVVEHAMRQVLEAHRAEVDYAVVRHAGTLLSLDAITQPVVCLIAARVGKVRLIDNMVVA